MRTKEGLLVTNKDWSCMQVGKADVSRREGTSCHAGRQC